MYYPYFISYMVAGLAISLVALIWALYNGQFKDQQRARYLPLKDEDETPVVKVKKYSRYETYALMFLVFTGLAVCAAVLIFALYKGNRF